MPRIANLCRADKVLLTGAAAVLGSSALFGAAPLTIGAAGAFAAVLLDGIFRPSSGTLYPTITHGPRDRAEVALTFDDGPDPAVTPAVLDMLAAYRASATFFVIGRYLQNNLAIAQRALAEGHELGNHSWTHSYFQNFYPSSKYKIDIARATQLIKRISGTTTAPLYRAPVGLKSPALARAAQEQKLKVVAWSLHSRDTLYRDARALAARTLARIEPGDIVLMHDGHERQGHHRPLIIDALPLILRGLEERGLRSVTVSRLLSEPATGGSGAMSRG